MRTKSGAPITISATPINYVDLINRQGQSFKIFKRQAKALVHKGHGGYPVSNDQSDDRTNFDWYRQSDFLVYNEIQSLNGKCLIQLDFATIKNILTVEYVLRNGNYVVIPEENYVIDKNDSTILLKDIDYMKCCGVYAIRTTYYFTNTQNFHETKTITEAKNVITLETLKEDVFGGVNVYSDIFSINAIINTVNGSVVEYDRFFENKIKLTTVPNIGDVYKISGSFITSDKVALIEEKQRNVGQKNIYRGSFKGSVPYFYDISNGDIFVSLISDAINKEVFSIKEGNNRLQFSVYEIVRIIRAKNENNEDVELEQIDRNVFNILTTSTTLSVEYVFRRTYIVDDDLGMDITGEDKRFVKNFILNEMVIEDYLSEYNKRDS